MPCPTLKRCIDVNTLLALAVTILLMPGFDLAG